MTETNKARDLVATLRDALHQLEGARGRTRGGVDAAVDVLEAFRTLDTGILDVQAEVDTLEAEMAEGADGQKA